MCVFGEQPAAEATDTEDNSSFKITFEVYSKKTKKNLRKIHEFLSYTEKDIS